MFFQIKMELLISYRVEKTSKFWHGWAPMCSWWRVNRVPSLWFFSKKCITHLCESSHRYFSEGGTSAGIWGKTAGWICQKFFRLTSPPWLSNLAIWTCNLFWDVQRKIWKFQVHFKASMLLEKGERYEIWWVFFFINGASFEKIPTRYIFTILSKKTLQLSDINFLFSHWFLILYVST